MIQEISASAPGKVILFGEHAVVFHRPAIAVPVSEVKAYATASFLPESNSGDIHLVAPDIHLNTFLSKLNSGHPFSVLFSTLKTYFQQENFPSFSLIIESDIPIAAGLGSGAAISVASTKAVSALLGIKLNTQEISNIAFEVEKIYHGTPSGIDNTAIAYAKPVFFIKDQPIDLIRVKNPFSIIVADSGVSSLTREAVAGVRQRWSDDPSTYEGWFNEIAQITHNARNIIQSGDPKNLGPLMVSNHALLQKIGVSTPSLDGLVDSALNAGAWGAKLAGAGCGGNMVAIVPENKVQEVSSNLIRSGAVRTFISHIHSTVEDYAK